MNASPRTLVVIATYNEIENLPSLVDEIFAHTPHVDILVVDDNSPDGTGRWCDIRRESEDRLHCLHRPLKEGLGAATIAGLQFALDRDYALAATMDADFSHHPRYLPQILRVAANHGEQAAVDVMVGSRYVRGGGVEGWPWYRRLMSRCMNAYARRLLRLPVRDCTGAFRCYQTATLRKLGLANIQSKGYAYLEEILWQLRRMNARFEETPIVFTDRRYGSTKINMREAVTALWIVFRLRLQGGRVQSDEHVQ